MDELKGDADELRRMKRSSSGFVEWLPVLWWLAVVPLALWSALLVVAYFTSNGPGDGLAAALALAFGAPPLVVIAELAALFIKPRLGWRFLAPIAIPFVAFCLMLIPKH